MYRITAQSEFDISYAVIFLFVCSSICSASAGQDVGRSQSDKYFTRQSPRNINSFFSSSEIRRSIHPVLNVQPHEDLKPGVINFEKLNDLIEPNEKINRTWDDGYLKAEMDASTRFYERVRGLSKAEIQKIAGYPDRKRAQPVVLSTNDNADWTYIFGLTPVVVRLSFENGNCTTGQACVYESDFKYLEWRRKEISETAIGKNISELIRSEGLPTNFHSPDVLVEHKKGECLLEYGGAANLLLRNGICESVSNEISLSCGPLTKTGKENSSKRSHLSFKWPSTEFFWSKSIH